MDEATLGRSHEGIELHNRSWNSVTRRVFPEQVYRAIWPKIEYWYTPAGTVYQKDDYNVPAIIKTKVPIFGMESIFSPGNIVMDIGCGGGDAAIGMAKKFKDTQILAIDYELGHAIPIPKHTMPNLRFQNEDWRQFSLSDNSIDAFISDQGIPLYGNIDSAVAELTRIAKKGALFRGTGTRGRSGVPNFDDRLAAFGWDVWHLRRNGTGDPTYCYSAQLKSK